MTALPSWARLVRADNPGPMTLDGTNTYLIRDAAADESVVVDPGPLDEAHLAAVAEAAGRVALVLLTHGHPDHADGAHTLQEMTGAPMAAVDPQLCVGTDPLVPGATYWGVAGIDVRVLGTPGHTSDSVSFVVLGEQPGLLTGDTVLGRGTTVVAHPDGRLRRLPDLAGRHPRPARSAGPAARPRAGRRRRAAAGHGVPRASRAAPRPGAGGAGGRRGSPQDVVRRVYADVDEQLWPAAELSVRAQLDYLAELGEA